MESLGHTPKRKSGHLINKTIRSTIRYKAQKSDHGEKTESVSAETNIQGKKNSADNEKNNSETTNNEETDSRKINNTEKKNSDSTKNNEGKDSDSTKNAEEKDSDGPVVNEKKDSDSDEVNLLNVFSKLKEKEGYMNILSNVNELLKNPDIRSKDSKEGKRTG